MVIEVRHGVVISMQILAEGKAEYSEVGIDFQRLKFHLIKMADQEELNKLFEAAIYGKKPPSRFGTPAEQVKAAPAAFQKAQSDLESADAVLASPFKAAPTETKPFLAVAAMPIQKSSSEEVASEEVVLDEKAVASLDENVNAEFEQITNKKIANAKAKRSRDRLMLYVLLIGSVVGGGGWLMKNPDKMESIQNILVEIRTTIDPTEAAGKYDKSLEKVAERGNQLGDASSMLGGNQVEGDDPGFDEEMKQISGEDSGLSPGEKQKKLKKLKEKMGKKEK
jgi:hypothetical protein